MLKHYHFWRKMTLTRISLPSQTIKVESKKIGWKTFQMWNPKSYLLVFFHWEPPELELRQGGKTGGPENRGSWPPAAQPQGSQEQGAEEPLEGVPGREEDVTTELGGWTVWGEQEGKRHNEGKWFKGIRNSRESAVNSRIKKDIKPPRLAAYKHDHLVWGRKSPRPLCNIGSQLCRWGRWSLEGLLG